jgi:ribosomal protein S18 acetylase RimI-like enzyme
MKRASLSDLEAIWSLREETSILLRERGIDQWQYDDPNRDVFKKDIAKGNFYVSKDGDQIVAMASIIIGTDPTYHVIHDGSWHTEAPYVTIHRLAVARSRLGSKRAYDMMLFAEELAIFNNTRALRVDTHPDNRYAIRLFNQLGYVKRGYILLPLSKGDRMRYVYDKTIEGD